MYYIFVENNKIIGAGELECLNEDILNIEISEELYNDFIKNPNKYIYQNNEIVNNPNYANEQYQQEILQQIEQIKAQLDNLDSKRIRAVCENEIKDSQAGETWLEYYNSKIIPLRDKLNELSENLL